MHLKLRLPKLIYVNICLVKSNIFADACYSKSVVLFNVYFLFVRPMTVVRGCLPIPLYYALLAFHECLANKEYDYDLFCRVNNVHSVCTRVCKVNFYVPTCSTNVRRNFITNVDVGLWYALTVASRESSTLSIFKSYLTK
jgi:hypothetical protein